MVAIDLQLPPSELTKERTVCSIQAAEKYQIPPIALLAVAKVEGGKPGQWVKNTNGTYDVGSMQLNTSYLKTLAKYGITSTHAASAGCFPYEVAAWRIRGHIMKDKGDFWTKIANYHSYTPKYNNIYRSKLLSVAYKMTARQQGNSGKIVRVSSHVAQSKKLQQREQTGWSTQSIYTPRAIYTD